MSNKRPCPRVKFTDFCSIEAKRKAWNDAQWLYFTSWMTRFTFEQMHGSTHPHWSMEYWIQLTENWTTFDKCLPEHVPEYLLSNNFQMVLETAWELCVGAIPIVFDMMTGELKHRNESDSKRFEDAAERSRLAIAALQSRHQPARETKTGAPCPP